jgi:hypothetical protein
MPEGADLEQPPADNDHHRGDRQHHDIEHDGPAPTAANASWRSVPKRTLEKEEGSGELLLRVRAAILGEETLIHRFGYQIVAHVRRVASRISGTIAVPDDILDLGGMSPADAAGLFQITANRIERVTPPAGFAFDKLVPVATGATGAVRNGPHDGFVDYVIDACPFSTPLQVEVRLAGRLAAMGVGVGQVAGPRPVVLTNLAPDANGVDFAVARFQPVR